MKDFGELGDTTASANAEVEMQIRGLMIDPVTSMPIVVLKRRCERYGTADLGRDLRSECDCPGA